MGVSTAISWTDHTFIPWWGCTTFSPGCKFCYAEAFAKRTGNIVWGKGQPRRFFGDKHWNEPRAWDRAAAEVGQPALVFCASIASVFEDRPDLVSHRRRLFDLICETPHLQWQLLTKRPENIPAMVPTAWLYGEWPANCWAGCTPWRTSSGPTSGYRSSSGCRLLSGSCPWSRCWGRSPFTWLASTGSSSGVSPAPTTARLTLTQPVLCATRPPPPTCLSSSSRSGASAPRREETTRWRASP